MPECGVQGGRGMPRSYGFSLWASVPLPLSLFTINTVHSHLPIEYSEDPKKIWVSGLVRKQGQIMPSAAKTPFLYPIRTKSVRMGAPGPCGHLPPGRGQEKYYSSA